MRIFPAAVWLGLASCAAAATPEHPNVLVIVVDNLGYGDVGCYGNTYIRTPAMNRLAREGVRLTGFYSAAANCSPARAAFLTGRYPQRNGVIDIPSGPQKTREEVLRPGERILPQYLRPAGYATMAIGKWHLGFAPGVRPTERGFDGFFGNVSGMVDYFAHDYMGQPDLYLGTDPVERKGYTTFLYGDSAVDYLSHVSARPFFLYLAFNAPSVSSPKSLPAGEPFQPWEAPADVIASYGPGAEHDQAARHAAVVTALDSSIGRVLDELDRAGHRNDTLVEFWSDNGVELVPPPFRRSKFDTDEASSGPFRGHGETLWEGGIHMPAMVRWPGQLPAGTVCPDPVIVMDFFVLAMEGAHVPLPTDRTIDGRDPLPTLQGRAGSPHDALYWEWRKWAAMRQGDDKILRETPSSPWELYNLKDDIGEVTDLSSREPDTVKRMVKNFQNWRRTVESP